MIVYVDNNVSRWHLTKLNINATVVYEVDELISSCSTIKLAIFHIPYPATEVNFATSISKIHAVLPHCQRIAIIGFELHNDTVEFCFNVNDPKIYYFVCGNIEKLNTTPWMDWFSSSCAFYKKNNNILDQLTPYQPKSKYFDILLGQPKPHRDVVYNYISKNNHTSKCIMTYMKNYELNVQQQDSSGWIGETGVEYIGQDFRWTVTPIKYFGHDMSLSQVVPIGIYNQTAYSVVAETSTGHGYNFYTEKTVKPILAKRLFLTLGGQYHLQNLRKLGFLTFDGIIDESYDQISDGNTRYKLILAQMDYLFSQPQQEVLDKIKPIVEHNYQIMTETDWYGNFTKDLKNYLINN